MKGVIKYLTKNIKQENIEKEKGNGLNKKKNQNFVRVNNSCEEKKLRKLI